MKLVSTLLASAFLAGTRRLAAGAIRCESDAERFAQPDKTISAATHCLDKATNQPRLKSATTGATTGGTMAAGQKPTSATVAAGNATAGDKSAKSTGTVVAVPAVRRARARAAAVNLPNC